MTETKKKRGRKSIKNGGVSAPRNIFCVCSSVINGKLVSEEIHCKSSGKDRMNKDVLKEAETIFIHYYGLSPIRTSGPYYKRICGNIKNPNNIISNLDIGTSNLIHDKLGSGIYDGWNVSVRLVEETANAAYISYKSHINNDKKSKPKNKFVELTDINNIKWNNIDSDIINTKIKTSNINNKVVITNKRKPLKYARGCIEEEIINILKNGQAYSKKQIIDQVKITNKKSNQGSVHNALFRLIKKKLITSLKDNSYEIFGLK